MDDNKTRLYNTLLYPALFIITLITFYPFFFSGLGCGDDFYNYLIAQKGEHLINAKRMAYIAGRFYFLIVMPVYSFPYIWDNMAITKILHFVPLIGSIFLFALIVKKAFRSKIMGYLFFLLFVTLTQASAHTSLLLTYPFFFTFSLCLLLLSFLFLQIYLEKGKKKFLVISAVFYLFGVLFYEVYLLFIFFAIIYIVAMDLRGSGTIRERIRNILIPSSPFIIIGIMYISAYFIFRIYHPSTYAGTTYNAKELTTGGFFQVLWKLSITAFPVQAYEATKTLFHERSELAGGFSPVVLDIILTARVEWLAKAILVGMTSFFLLVRIEKRKYLTLLLGFLIGGLIVFTPHIPLAMTVKYAFYTAHGMVGYVTTFFSQFGVYLVALMLIGLIMKLCSFSRILKYVVASAFVVVLIACSVITDFSNYMVARDVRRANIPIYALDEMIHTERFQAIPQRSAIYMKDLYENQSFTARNLMLQGFNWDLYIAKKINRSYECSKTLEQFKDYLSKHNSQAYYMTVRQARRAESVFIALGQVDRDTAKINHGEFLTNKALMTYYSSYKFFSVSFSCKSKNPADRIPVRINHIRDTIRPSGTITINIFNTQPRQKSSTFTIEADQLDLKSIRVSDFVNLEEKIVYL